MNFKARNTPVNCDATRVQNTSTTRAKRRAYLIAKGKKDGGKKRMSRLAAAVLAWDNAKPSTAKMIAKNTEIDAVRDGEREGSDITKE